MAITFPTTLDSLTNPTASDAMTSPSHATQHANANDAIEALEAKVGINSSAVTTSHDFKLGLLTGEYVNVKTYGAIGSGSVDEITAFYAAVAALPAAGGTVFVPPGTYRFDTIFNPTKSLRIVGAGMGVSIIKRGDSINTTLWLIQGTKSVVTALTFDGNGSVNTTTSGELAFFANECIADGNEFKNYHGAGIIIYESGIRIVNNLIVGMGDASIPSFGIWGAYADTDGVLISGNVIRDNGINGIYVCGKDISITNNYLEGNHCQISPVGGGQIDIEDSAINENIIVSGNVINAGGGILTEGIELAGGGVSVIGNTIRANLQGGIGLQLAPLSGTKKRTIIGNIVTNIGRSGVPNAAIQIRAGVSDFIVSGNVCYDDRTPKYQGFGIQVASGASNNYVICGNLFDGSLATGILDEGTGTNKLIRNNTPYAADLASGATSQAFDRVTLASSDRVIVASTNRLSVADLDIGRDNYVGFPKSPSSPFTVRDGYYLPVWDRLTLTNANRATLQGASDLIMTDNFRSRSRITLAGNGSP